jgi:outer membrane immunogenic protein
MPFRIACLLVVCGWSASAFAQELTKSEVSGGLSYLHSNTADGICGCFSLLGGSGTFVLNANQRFSGVVDVGYQRASNVNSTGIDLGLFTFMSGPRLSFRGQKITLFGQVLAGGVHSHSNSTFNNANGFAGSAGIGVDLRLTRRFSWRILQMDYLLTRVSNGANNMQNNVRFTTGIVIRLGSMPAQGPHRPYNRPY